MLPSNRLNQNQQLRRKYGQLFFKIKLGRIKNKNCSA